MASKSAKIRATWQPNSAVPHRVCWREAGLSPEPEYNCTTDATHPNCGTSDCAYDIPITIDDETCDTVSYEGYVQPTCYDESSETGRIPFTIDFVPDPACTRYEVICDYSPIDAVAITNPGSGYDPLNPPAVAFSGGGGVGATAIATVGDGEIESIAITNAGSGYSNGSYPGTSLVGGSGIGATADITIAGGVVTVANVAAEGSGYRDGEILAPDPGVVGVPGTPADLTINTDYGSVIDITVTDGGDEYTSDPTVVIDAPSPGTTALATASLRGCSQLTVQDCSGASSETIAVGTYQPGESIFFCGENEPTTGDDYSVVEDGNCLCNCIELTLRNDGGDTVDLLYILCDGNVETTTLGASSSVTKCIVEGSLQYTENGATSSFASVNNGTCTP